MFEQIVNVKLINARNSFCFVSNNLKFKPGTILKVIYNNEDTVFLSVISSPIKLADDFIAISNLYGKALGIEENDQVSIVEIDRPLTVQSLSVVPQNQDDFEVLETFAQIVQTTLLDQITIVNNGQKIVIFIGGNIHVTVLLDDLKPASPGLIDLLTEVTIKPPTKLTSLHKKIRDISKINSKINFIKPDIVLRIVDQKYLNESLLTNYFHPFNTFISRSDVDWQFNEINSLKTVLVARLFLLGEDEPSIYVRILFLEDFNHEVIGTNNLFANQLILQRFHERSNVLVQFIEQKQVASEIIIHTKKTFLFDVIEQFKLFIAERSSASLLLPADYPFKFNGIVCKVKLTPLSTNFIIINDEVIRELKFSLVDEQILINKDIVPKLVTNYFEYEQEVIQEIVSNLNFQQVNCNVLLVGENGTGKTTILQQVKKNLEDKPQFLWNETVSCRNLKGKTQDSIQRTLSQVASNLIKNQPACLILDDLHVICEAVKGDEQSPNTVYHNRVSEMVNDFLTKLCTLNSIRVIATCRSTDCLNNLIYSSRGKHLFKCVIELQPLEKDDRRTLLQNFLSPHKLEANIDEITDKTEGFVLQDFVNLSKKILFETLKEDSSTITLNHCQLALNNLQIAALHNVKLQSKTKKFHQIGGLKHAKQTLVESVLWPVKYSEIFAKAPLRLPSGLLLYGPPGTGKTLLAQAAASHCDLRLISIKGPELLSKYIGASEQAVRDTFQKAQNAKPCILFFDEFDSLAPRRGHDNTGVTDRVVNQLLTQLDGIESLTGVCVLAATSRPDLLDPALLRPGRLDQKLCCPLPDLEDRLDILKVLSENLSLDEVHFEKIAQKTEGFTGADLQSLLYTAQMATIDFSQENNLSSGKVTQEHLEDALQKTRPSLTSDEMRKYQRILSRE